MTPLAPLRRVLSRACPPGVDPVDWRRAQEALGLPAAPYATATGEAWPYDGPPPYYGLSREEAHRWRAPLAHLEIDPFA